MKIVILTKDKYEIWDKFCLQSDDAWFWHTTGWLEYTLDYKPELKTQNLSFFVYNEDKVEAVVCLTQEVYKLDGENISEFSFGGWAIPAPALDNTLSGIKRSSVYKFIFNKLDELAYQNKVSRTRLRLTPISSSFLNKDIPYNYLMEFGYLPNEDFSQLSFQKCFLQ